jgi:chitinase
VGDVWVAFDGAVIVADKLAFTRAPRLLPLIWPMNYDNTNVTDGVKNRSVSARVTPIS